MQMLGVRNQRQKREQRYGVRPPQRLHCAGRARHEESRQVRCHQCEDQERNEARAPRKLAQPLGPHQKSPHKENGDACRAGDGKDRRKIEINSSHASRRIEEAKAENHRAVIQCNQREGAERPENESVRHAHERPLADHLRLQQHLPDEVPHPFADRKEMKIRIIFRLQNFSEDGPEAPPEPVDGGCRQGDEQTGLPERKVPRLGQGWQQIHHGCTKPQYTMGSGPWRRIVRPRSSRFIQALAAHNLRRVDATRRVPRIDHQLRLLHNLGVVVIGVVGHNHHRIILL